ncbi:hypothetical protein [Mesorhizobium sp.]|uniref:hypothetical protein n=1 Tax=Mesorhizobium sp. TaxID=1871066 RepID=UPI0025BB871A|nr:hypothetical protein [Mesorhizobium sp.]
MRRRLPTHAIASGALFARLDIRAYREGAIAEAGGWPRKYCDASIADGHQAVLFRSASLTASERALGHADSLQGSPLVMSPSTTSDLARPAWAEPQRSIIAARFEV